MNAHPLRAAVVTETARRDRLDDPADAAALLALLRHLYAIGRQDLPLGRLFEGHVDALQIVTRYGTPTQAESAVAAARAGGAFGVWNADHAEHPIRLDGLTLTGGKSFASGAGLLSHALVTVDAPGGRQLILLDLGRTAPTIDPGWWRTTGMQRSETHRVQWDGAAVSPQDLIGSPGDYVREPWFSGGALRFAAVQAGGIAALLDRTRDHLVRASRAADPHQSARLAELYSAAAAAAAAVREAGEQWFADPDARLARVAAARVAVYAAGDAALTLAQQAVGLQGMFVDHPLSATLTDLTVYLRQPAPDAQRMAVAAAVADRRLVAAL